MWRIHKIPLNESLLLCELAVCTPIAPSGGVCPLPSLSFLSLFFCLLASLQFTLWLLSGNATHAPFSQSTSIDCSPYGSIKRAR